MLFEFFIESKKFKFGNQIYNINPLRACTLEHQKNNLHLQKSTRKIQFDHNQLYKKDVLAVRRSILVHFV